MLTFHDNLAQSISAMQTHKLRSSLTMLGLTMGVATLITVMTIVQGANLYVESKIANLGTNVFQIARTPFAVTDFNIVIKALKYKKIGPDDVRAVVEGCSACQEVGGTASATVRARSGDKESQDVSFYGQTPSMADIDARAVEFGRYFTAAEAEHRANVCLIGDTLVQRLFLGVDPIGRNVRIGNDEFMVIGIMEKVGSVLGQDQDNFVTVPLSVFLRIQGIHSSLTINVKARTGSFEIAQDQAQLILRARRHLTGQMENDFFIGTKESYMALWRSISSAFFGVFIMVSAISVVIGGIVIMNVMLVSVTLRKREIGVRRAVGATQRDILEQFISESLIQCLVGGIAGIGLGFLVALLLRSYSPFPASVRTWVAVMGLVMSSAVGLFFGIYPAVRASRLDPVVALRSD
ncbi:MAG TPA: ABC transporter permease [Candidatus Sulfotelmatobacter sp.]|jgi:putative ABC transport system permease protein|nr:ABC transporter permease [Candidatus Sulfotelmatobacter sp.]